MDADKDAPVPPNHFAQVGTQCCGIIRQLSGTFSNVIALLRRSQFGTTSSSDRTAFSNE
jgi:hypothetical protein